jgi:hypothetical protein
LISGVSSKSRPKCVPTFLRKVETRIAFLRAIDLWPEFWGGTSSHNLSSFELPSSFELQSPSNFRKLQEGEEMETESGKGKGRKTREGVT